VQELFGLDEILHTDLGCVHANFLRKHVRHALYRVDGFGDWNEHR
jgi:hypothetical protein